MAAKKNAPPVPFDGRLRIRATQPGGFWRASVFHPGSAVEHEGGKFTVDQVERFKAETMLVVEDLAPEAPAAPAK